MGLNNFVTVSTTGRRWNALAVAGRSVSSCDAVLKENVNTQHLGR
jgi:hypothetical protein